ncbi:uncharacterized protein LOC107857171 isoform X4 [Capsicum annuum]|uniref:uncharacterized protein LOC107857171 isoform X4 n=1 Tax=Capsicum annuum TaxID=4072 RepID=UPI001FB12800|nr:uncharacterized protein LOC107857171 isoform X4 [Capsicum annuum]
MNFDNRKSTIGFDNRRLNFQQNQDQDATHPPAHSQSQSSTSSLLASDDLYGFSKEQHDHLLSMLQQNRLHDSGLCASATFGHSLKKPLEVGKLSNGLYVLQLNDSLQLPTITSQVLCENQAALHIARNLFFHEHTKYIEIDCFFVREKLKASLISLQYVPTSLQLADLLTKPLTGVQHRDLLSKLGLGSSLRGDVRNELVQSVAPKKQFNPP